MNAPVRLVRRMASRAADAFGAGALPDIATLPKDEGGLHTAADIRKTIKVGLIVVLVAFGGFGTWAALAPLSGAVIGHGIVKVDLNRKTIQHLEGGIVKEILVRDGDHVNAGDGLIVIEDARVNASVDVVQGQLDAEMAKAARLAAERDGTEFITFPEELTSRMDNPDVAQLVQSETGYFETQRKSVNDQIALIQQQIVESHEQVAAQQGRAKAFENAAALLQEEVDANESLEKAQYVQKVHVLGLKRGIEEYKAQRGELLADMAVARQKITDLDLRIVTMRDQYVQGSAKELTVSRATIFDLEERLRPSQDAQRRQRIIAPIDGTVVDLKVYTIGGVIGPREPLMDIVPDTNPLIIEMQLDVDSIDDVHIGQEADVRMTAYTRRTTPLVIGKLIYISADRLTNPKDGTAYYLAHVEVSRESLKEAPDIKLQPGMMAEVFIRTGERTMLDYMLAPITQSLRRSFREP